MQITQPKFETLPQYYKLYAGYIKGNDLLHEMVIQRDNILQFIISIPKDQHNYAYAEGKWTIKEVIGHLIDAERVLCYRAMRISRGDKTPLPGFNENMFATQAGYNERDISSILAEFLALRDASILFFRNLNADKFDEVGIANSITVSVRQIMFFIIAHTEHHFKVINEKYLNRLHQQSGQDQK